MSGSNTWPLQALGPLCTKVGSGSTPRGGESVYQDEGVAFVRSQNVHNGLFHDEGLAFIGEEAAHKLRGVTVQSSDVLLNITGDSVARCCMIPEARLPARVSQHVAIIRPRSEFLRPRFLMYYLTSPFMQATLLSIAGSGGTRKAITKTHIEKLKVPLPSPEVQDSILNELSAYDDLIENNRKRIKLLERAARLLYTEWFVRGRFPGHQGLQVKDGVPKGWERKRLDEMAAVNERTLPRKYSGTIQYVDIASVSTGSIDKTEEYEFEDAPGRARRLVADGDIIWSCVRPNRRSYAQVVAPPINLVVSTGFAVITPKVVGANYLYHAVTTDEFVGYLTTNAQGAAYPAVRAKDFEASMVIKPADKVMKEFEERVEPMTRLRSVLTKENSALARARDMLLPRLMSGKVRV